MKKEEFLQLYEDSVVGKIEQMDIQMLEQILKQVMNIEFKNVIVPIPYVGNSYEIVTYYTDELVARCPMTRIIDFYKLTIKYVPKKLLPELKSLKFYLFEFTDLPISHEHLAVRIMKDFITCVNPTDFYLKLKVSRRGGIDTTVEAGNIKLR